MKKFYSVIAAFSAAVIMWACGPAEIGYKQEFTLQGLYTVNKATVAPEFSDTMFFVRNIEDYDLKTGDRALLLLHYEYDAYNGKAAQWTIEEVLKRIPVYPLSLKSDIDTDAYTTPITGLQPLNFFNAFTTRSWVWKGKQNLSIKYKGVEEGASFALTVRGVNNGSVEMELFIDAEESDKEVATLLTFDISNIADFLSDADKASLPSNIDDIRTTIYVKRMSDGNPKEDTIKRDDIK
ncbi:MAG: hypothetical protein J6V47_08065 [Bacteroidaceae bacterium]|nr:hypothetical protein [Bacteroidaceae bacterium]